MSYLLRDNTNITIEYKRIKQTPNKIRENKDNTRSIHPVTNVCNFTKIGNLNFYL